MTIAERLSGRVTLALGDKTWRLLVTYGVLLDCEEASSVDMLQAAEVERPSARLLQSLLWALVRRAGAVLSPREVGALLTPRTLPAALEAVQRAWILSMPEPQKAKPRRLPGKRATWIDLWTLADQALHIGTEQWLSLTPRLFAALEQRWLEQKQHEEMLASIIASTTANYAFSRPQKMLPPDHFMLHPIDHDAGPVTGEYIMSVLAPYTKRRKAN